MSEWILLSCCLSVDKTKVAGVSGAPTHVPGQRTASIVPLATGPRLATANTEDTGQLADNR